MVATGNTPALSCGSYDSGNPPVFTNNDVFSAGASGYDASCPSLTGTNGNIDADPLFVALLSSNYRLQVASPAINAGTTCFNLPATDFAGDPRILNNIVDVGVAEYLKKTVLSLSSYSLDYSAQAVGSSSAPQAVTLTNHGATRIAITFIGTGSSFSQTNDCGTSLGTVSAATFPSALPRRLGVRFIALWASSRMRLSIRKRLFSLASVSLLRFSIMRITISMGS